MYIDRTRSGRQDGLGGNGWSGRAPRPEQARGKPLTLRVLVDRSTIEVYGDGGLRVLSANVLPLMDTTTTSVSTAGTTTLLVQRTIGFVAGQTLRVNADANGPLAGMRDYKVAAVGTGLIDSTLAAPVVPGDRNLKLANVNNFVPGGSVTMGSGPSAERIAVAPAGVGTAASPPTMLFADVPAGATNIKVGSVAGFASGASIVIGSEGRQETATVASVGTRGRETTLAVEAASGDGTVKVASIMGLAVGGPVVIGAGTASAETRTIAGPVGSDGAFNGTAGPQGAGVMLSAPLSIAHAAGATLHFLGTGITLASPMTGSHLSGAAISLPGTGVTLASPVTMVHAVGEPVTDPGTGLTCISSAHGDLAARYAGPHRSRDGRRVLCDRRIGHDHFGPYLADEIHLVHGAPGRPASTTSGGVNETNPRAQSHGWMTAIACIDRCRPDENSLLPDCLQDRSAGCYSDRGARPSELMLELARSASRSFLTDLPRSLTFPRQANMVFT